MPSYFIQKVLKKKQLLLNGIAFTLLLLFLLSILYWIPRPDEYVPPDPDVIKQEEAAIERLFIEFEGAIRDGDFARAYEMMNPQYREKFSLESFRIQFTFLQKGERRLEPQRSITVRSDNTAKLRPKGPCQDYGATFEFEKIAGVWYLTDKVVVIQK